MSAHQPQCPEGSDCEDCFHEGYPEAPEYRLRAAVRQAGRVVEAAITSLESRSRVREVEAELARTREELAQVKEDYAECQKGFNESMDIEGRLTAKLEIAQQNAKKWEERCDTLGTANLDLEWLMTGLRLQVARLEKELKNGR